MAKNQYTKTELNRFKKSIQKKIDEISGNMDEVRDDLKLEKLF